VLFILNTQAENAVIYKIVVKPLVYLLMVASFFATSIAISGIHSSSKNDTREVQFSRLISTSFAGKHSAWLVTLRDRNLLYTHNGGQQWQVVPSETVGGFGQINFISESQGWAIGSKGGIWKTLDGGKHWELLIKLESHDDKGFFGKQLQFIDELNGWIIEAPNYLWQTIDGGKSWKTLSLSDGYKADLVRLYFNNTQVGWLGCDKGILFRTINGGKSWELEKVRRPETFYDLWFANDNIGWALIGNSIYRSLDSGRTWKIMLSNEEAFESPIILDIGFRNDRSGWAVGHSNGWAGNVSTPSEIKGVVLYTDDRGVTWQRPKVDIDDKIFSQVFFPEQRYGWLISSTYVYRTNDGGQSWKKALKIP
jgi:photosystem II stability/assembly factor-like uncharacterized protein